MKVSCLRQIAKGLGPVYQKAHLDLDKTKIAGFEVHESKDVTKAKKDFLLIGAIIAFESLGLDGETPRTVVMGTLLAYLEEHYS